MWVVASKHAMRDRSPLQTTLTLVLLGATFYGIIFSARASRAFQIYYDTKYEHSAYESEVAQTGRPLLTPQEINDRCEEILRLYPFSYLTCHIAAEASYHNRHVDFYPLLEQSRRWTDRGLNLNPYHQSLTLRRVGIYEKLYDYETALMHMKTYTEWNFWDPFNHARLAVLHAKLGDFETADKELMTWVRYEPSFRETRKEIERIKARHAAAQTSPDS